ncbi:hypothetical protein DXG01_005168 [Tephrocybe rancida]|nr:hypothetical protein DXG01_005168 [Tephrocybe rancida]
MGAPPSYNAANNGINDSKHSASAAASDKPKPPDYPQPLEPGLPPRYDFPQTFAIGARRTSTPLVSSVQLKNHLALLHAFVGLRTRIDGLYPERNEEIPSLPREGERRWGWFVGLAVERFSLWCEGLKEADLNQRARDVLPPVDVLMVRDAGLGFPSCTQISIGMARVHAESWVRLYHQYNHPNLTSVQAGTPRIAAVSMPCEASNLLQQYSPTPSYVFTTLSCLSRFPQRLRQASELEDILTSEPTQSRLDFWGTTTRGRHFDPIRDAELHHTRNVLCPKCRHSLPIAYTKEDTTGFFQQKFQVQCPSDGCRDLPRITRTLLGARKLAEDLAGAAVKADVATPSLATRFAYSGTLRIAQKAIDTARGTLVRDTILRGPSFEKPAGGTEEWIVAILTRNKYDLEVLREAMAGRMNMGGGNLYGCFHSNLGADNDWSLCRLTRITSAYQTAYVFSVDLVGAVLRQGSFVKKMHDLQWTQPGFFDSKNDEVALQHSIARYHAFLDLMSKSNASFYVPTLDIDLAWHTHQLLWQTYHNDCMNYVGRYVDQLVLSSHLPLTGDQSSHSDDKVEEQTLATAFDVTCLTENTSDNQTHFNMPYTHCGCPLPGTTIGQRLSRLVNHYGAQKSYLIPPAREDLLAATHPSDHNAVFVWHRKHFSEGLQQRRRGKFKARQERDARERGKGKARALTPEERRRVDAHEAAFLVPVPLYYYGYGGCAAYTGAVVYSANDNGIGGCAAAVCAVEVEVEAEMEAEVAGAEVGVEVDVELIMAFSYTLDTPVAVVMVDSQLNDVPDNYLCGVGFNQPEGIVLAFLIFALRYATIFNGSVENLVSSTPYLAKESVHGVDVAAVTTHIIIILYLTTIGSGRNPSVEQSMAHLELSFLQTWTLRFLVPPSTHVKIYQLMLQMLFSDSAVTWRAWILWSQHKWLKVVTCLGLLGLSVGVSIQTMIIEFQSLTPNTRNELSVPRLLSRSNVIYALPISAGVNMVATAVMGVKYWVHRKAVKVLQRRRRFTVDKVFIVLADSGIAFFW